MINFSCERDLSDEAVDATFSKTGAIFLDAPVEMGSDFYFPYGGSKPNAWSVDNQVSYKGSASMRFDVPNANDPEGNYAGAIFRTEGAGRNLTDYDALTFYVKASQGVVIGEFGFGEDFIENKYMTTLTNVSVGTTWTKIIIPLPDASKLIKERGMFRYSAGSQGTNGAGYTLWIDELKFEKLGSILPLNTSIMNGSNITNSTFVGVTSTVSGIIKSFNLPNGINQSVNISPSYLNFITSDPSVAIVNDLGVITPIEQGTTIITASFNGQPTSGSLTINCQGVFLNAPIPTRNPANVLSVFSDTYNNVPVTYYNGFWTPGSTTGSADFSVNGNNILNYTTFNYVGIAFANPTLNATEMTNIHFNMYIPGSVPSNFSFLISIEDWGPNQVDNGGDDTRQQIFVTASQVQANTWITIESPLTLVNKNNIGLIIMENINGSSLTNFYMDNIYFYKN
ncbi:glycosyl hydrolase family 16 [Flavobacterium sp.]|uniref:glycosyl hydrolase family 16 n=1 Tax=Flavobacterium sp. TaxID=239 RepID=UPI0039E46F25